MIHHLTILLVIISTFAPHPSTSGYSWRLSTTPSEVVTISHGESMAIVCQTQPAEPLADCGFQIGPPLLQGKQLYMDAKDPVKEFWNLTVTYNGERLSSGMCQLQLSASSLYKEENFPVGCRVRADRGGWEYVYASIIDTSWLPKEISLTTEPKEAYHLPGSNLTVHCDSTNGYTLEKCSFTLPRKEKFDLSPTIPNGDFRYSGDGLANGKCGIFIPNISEVVKEANDVISCETYITYRKIPTRELQINTAHCASDRIDLEMSFLTIDNATEKSVRFRCVTPSCRPPATISWYLNGTLVPEANVSEEVVDKWRWQTDLQTTTQVLTMNNAPDFIGQTVQCVVEHAAFKDSRRLDIPSPDSSFPWWLIVIIVVVVLIIAIAVVVIARRRYRQYHRPPKNNVI